jgi:hypothetical protein
MSYERPCCDYNLPRLKLQRHTLSMFGFNGLLFYPPVESATRSALSPARVSLTRL